MRQTCRSSKLNWYRFSLLLCYQLWRLSSMLLPVSHSRFESLNSHGFQKTWTNSKKHGELKWWDHKSIFISPFLSPSPTLLRESWRESRNDTRCGNGFSNRSIWDLACMLWDRWLTDDIRKRKKAIFMITSTPQPKVKFTDKARKYYIWLFLFFPSLISHLKTALTTAWSSEEITIFVVHAERKWISVGPYVCLKEQS